MTPVLNFLVKIKKYLEIAALKNFTLVIAF